MKLSVVIPCYNEAKNIPLILERLEKIGVSSDKFEFVMVNNGSTDNSEDVFEELAPNYDYVKVVNVEINKGYGYGILSGLKNASGEFLGWTHADMQTDPKDIVRAYDILKAEGFSKKLYIKGDRKGRPFWDQFFTSGMSMFESFYMNANLRDINAQPNIFHRSFFESWNNAPEDFALDLFALYMATKMKLKIIRFPVVFPERVHGESNWNTGLKSKWKFIKRTIDFSVELKKRL